MGTRDFLDSRLASIVEDSEGIIYLVWVLFHILER